MFVGRERELEVLSERIRSDRFELIVIYGRRRVGKTRLVLESIKDTDHIYYLATTKNNLRSFRDDVSRKDPGIKHTAENWTSTLRSLKDRVLVFDEFPYMISDEPSITSVFQKVIDLDLKDTRTKIILLGSSITMMTDRVLGYSSPLYGRRTSTIDLGPLSFSEVLEYYPNQEIEEVCRIFAVTDGIPYYMEKVRPPFSIWFPEEIGKPDSFLREEVDFLLRYEFKELGNYKRILNAISLGRTKPSEIKDHCGMKHADIMPYLRNLINVRLVERVIPIGEKENSKRGRYYLSDNLISFWFRFIQPNRSAIVEGIFDPESIYEDFNRYMGSVFERIARDQIIDLMRKDEIPFKFNRIGKWWHRGEEIDLVCLDEKSKKALLIEVKWKDLDAGECRSIINDLRRKGKLLPFNGYERYHGIYSRRNDCTQELVFSLED